MSQSFSKSYGSVFKFENGDDVSRAASQEINLHLSFKRNLIRQQLWAYSSLQLTITLFPPESSSWIKVSDYVMFADFPLGQSCLYFAVAVNIERLGCKYDLQVFFYPKRVSKRR